MSEHNHIDDLFKKGLENPPNAYNHADWIDMESRLNQDKAPVKRYKWRWMVAACFAAATLLLFLTTEPELQTVAKKAPTLPQKIVVKKVEKIQKIEKPMLPIKKWKTTALLPQDSVITSKHETFALIADTQETTHALHRIETHLSDSLLEIDVADRALLDYNVEAVKGPMQDLANTPTSSKKMPTVVFGVSVLPEVTSVQSAGSSSMSAALGVEANIILSSKLSLSPGLTYGTKNYESDFSFYKPNTNYAFKVQPNRVNAVCDVLDLSLNLNYKVFEQKKISIILSTGLSSYLMIKERYDFAYLEGKRGPTHYEVRNKNQHYLGVANIGLQFQQKVNNRWSISAKPFVKLPLTGIGYGNARLTSVGLAFTVDMNFMKSK